MRIAYVIRGLCGMSIMAELLLQKLVLLCRSRNNNVYGIRLSSAFWVRFTLYARDSTRAFCV